MRWGARLVVAGLIAIGGPVSSAVAGEGNPDPGFGASGVAVVPTGNGNQSSGEAIVMQGTKAIVAGEAVDDTGGGPVLRGAVTRVNADGTRDAGFGTGGQFVTTAGTGASQLFAVALAPDGKVVAAGTVRDGGVDKVLVVRLLADGAPDAGFGPGGARLLTRGDGGSAAATGVLVEAGGSVVVAGHALDGGSTKVMRAKLAADGTPQAWGGLSAIGTDGLARANAIGRLGDGDYVLAGEAASGENRPFVARVAAADGALTAGWGTAGDGTSQLALDTIAGAYGLTVKGDQVVVTGASADGSTQVIAAAFRAGDGAVDGTFGTAGMFRAAIGDGGTSRGRAITTDAAGRFLIAGEASQERDGTPVFHFMTVRLTPGGGLDGGYGTGGSALAVAPGNRAATGNGIAIAPGGKAVLAGRAGEGPGETLAAVRFCTETAQPCATAVGDVSLPAQSDLAMSEQCGSSSIRATADVQVGGGYRGRVTVSLTSSDPSKFRVEPATQTVEATADGPLPIGYTVTHTGNAADSATITVRVAPEGRGELTRTLTARNSVLTVTGVSPATATTPRDLAPGSTLQVTVGGLALCGTAGYAGAPGPTVRVGNDRALVRPTRTDETLSFTTPRLATTGTVEVVGVDAAGAITSRAAAPGTVTVDTYRNSLGFAFRNFTAEVSFDDMVRAFGVEDMFVCIHVPFVGCVPSGVPDPWALTVWGVLQLGNGSCFGFSWVSEWMREGKLKPGDFAAGATTPFAIGGMPQSGDAPAVRPQNITDEIEAAWARQFSEDYMAFYRRKTLLNLVAQTPASLRSEIETMMRRGDHPLLSIRDGGTIGGLHVVTAYDIEDDPNEPGAYFLHVYDSNSPYDPADVEADGQRNADKLAGTTLRFGGRRVDNRIHVRADGSWSMPSSSFGGKQLANIIAGPWDLPTEDADLISPASGVTTAVTLFIAWAGEGVANLRADGATPTTAPPASIQSVTAGKKTVETVPWTLATGGPAPVEGRFIPAGAPYEVKLRGDRDGRQTQVLFGRNTVTKVTTAVQRGATDSIEVAPKRNEVAIDPGAAAAPVTVEMSARTAKDAWRTATLDTTTRGSDGLRYDRAKDAYVLDHDGPAATVKLTFSSLEKTVAPQEATATLRVGRDQQLSLKPRSWRRLGGGALVVRSRGKARSVRLRGSSATRLRMGTPSVRTAGKRRTARVAVTVPRDTAAGTAKVTYVVRRGKRRVATRTIAAGRPGRRTVSFALPATARRGDTLTVVGQATRRRGTRFTVATATRSARVR